MKNKITLITPSDFFENQNKSLMFICIDDNDQERLTKWLSNSLNEDNINIYFYMGEDDVPWLLYAAARSDYVFLNLDTQNQIVSVLSSYLISKSNVYVQTRDETLGKIINYINPNRVPDIDFFLEKALAPLNK